MYFLCQLITILFGANDICSAQCYNPQQFSPLRYALHLRRTLDFLRIALPRTLVNLIPAIGNKLILYIYIYIYIYNNSIFQAR